MLERIALEFEPGRRYDETEVNTIVGAFFTDHASLRRYLVDEGFLDREPGDYWRAGGRVDVDLTRSLAARVAAEPRADLPWRSQFPCDLDSLPRTGSASVSLLLLAGSCSARARVVHRLPGPCDFPRVDDEIGQHLSKRQIICAVGAFGPVPGGASVRSASPGARAAWTPTATSSPTGSTSGCTSTRPHVARPLRGQTQPVWELSRPR